MYPVLFVNGLSQSIKDGKTKDGDELEVDLEKGEIKDLTNGNNFHCDAVADLEMDIMKAGGLLEYLKEKAVSK